MHYPNNIALTGLLRSGKDTLAAYLAHRYGYVRFAFGDGIREVCRRLYPEQFADGAKPRALLQQFGEYARTHDRDVWINDMFRKIANFERINGDPLRIVVSDLRQPHEIERLKSEGYVIIRVNAPESLRIHRAIESADKFAYSDLRHETEQHVDEFEVDHEISNDGTVDELYAQIDAIMAKLTEAPE